MKLNITGADNIFLNHLKQMTQEDAHVFKFLWMLTTAEWKSNDIISIFSSDGVQRYDISINDSSCQCIGFSHKHTCIHIRVAAFASQLKYQPKDEDNHIPF